MNIEISGYRDHFDTDGNAASGIEQGEEQGQTNHLPEQYEADGHWSRNVHQ